MTESTKSVHALGGVPESPAPTGLAGLGLAAAEDPTSPSVRELLTELAALEDAMRGPHRSAALRPGEPNAEWRAALAREQEIIDELHRRCPEAPQPS
jgi:hypothetical protein